jgi:Spy/CpxP family protein refolding chaperone
MKTSGKLALALGAIALIVGPARAQGPGVLPGPFGGGGWILVSNKGVQEELKVSEVQARKLEDFARDAREKGMKKMQEIRDLPAEQRRAQTQELLKASNEDLRKGLADILKPEQIKRFDQIATRASGPDAFAIVRVQEALKLTDDQKAKLTAIQADLRKAMFAAQGAFAADRQAGFKKIAELRKGAVEKSVALLTDDQKATWKDLTGEPYEVKFEAPRRPNN